MSKLIELWRGGVNTWECDSNLHMNTRFYVQRASEALAMLFALSGLPGLFGARSGSTAVVREMHIRFHREARLAAPLRIMGGLVSAAETTAQAVLIMEDTLTGEVKATFLVDLQHVDSDLDTAPRAWPASLAYAPVKIPPHALPRSISQDAVTSAATAAQAHALGLTRISAGTIGAERLDIFGRMAAHGFIGAVSDGIRTLSGPMREIVARDAEISLEQMGGAVLEFRILHLSWPRGGDTFEIRSGLAGVEGNVKSLIHWMFDPVSGQVYGSMQSIAVDFDLVKRSIVKLSDTTRAELQTMVVPGLAL